MVKIFLFLLVAIYKNQCQRTFGGKFSSYIPRPKIQEEYLSEKTILKGDNQIRNPDFSGTLPQQVLIRVRIILVLNY